MNLSQFFERLPKDGWVLFGGLIRRGNPHLGINLKCQCPVSSLRNRPAIEFRSVAELAGLPYDLVSHIADAADNECDTPSTMRIRRLLLKHCGLQEVQQ